MTFLLVNAVQVSTKYEHFYKYEKSLLYYIHLCSMWTSVKGKLEPFLSVAGQTLESFVKSLDEEEKPQQQNYNSHEHQFVLGLAGVITSKG